MARLSPYAFFQQFDNNGNPLSGGKVYTYEAGTSTPKATYTDAGGLIANANPVVLDSAGRADIWLGAGSYKFILKTSTDTTLETIDNVAGDTSNAFGSSVVSISGNLSITSAYKNNVIIATANATLSLLAAASAEDGFYFVIKNDSASATVTIDPNLAELVDGASTRTIRAGQAAIVICNGTGWNTIFLDSLNIFADNITATTSAGIALKNNSAVTVLTLGAGGGTGVTFAGGVNITGALGMTGAVNTAASSTGGAGLNAPHGTAPTSPVNGDLWTTTSGIFARINGATKQLNDQTPLRFISSAQTITPAGSLTLAHSLGSNPVEFNAYLTCTTADAGYSIGARVAYYPMGQGNVSASSNSGVSINSDATNLNIRFGQSVSPSTMFIAHATTGNLTGITNSSWTITFIAKP